MNSPIPSEDRRSLSVTLNAETDDAIDNLKAVRDAAEDAAESVERLNEAISRLANDD